jgi:glyoxylase-like metal-dependent hydrolase (beta-lactamase superfamily II)
VLIDPGEESARFLAELGRQGLRLEAIWLTHAHVDHIMGVEAVKRETGAPVYLHPADRPLYDALPGQGDWMGLVLRPPPPPDRDLEDGEVLSFGEHRFTVRHTPGHSPGSVSYLGDGRVFSGDVLFSGSIGRTDLPGGDYHTLLHSIQSVLLALPDSTVVHSGHGPDTTVGVERVSNPFLVGASRLA